MSSALIGKCNASVLKTERNAVHRADTETAYTVVPSQPKPLGTVSCSRTIVSRPGSPFFEQCERVRIDQSPQNSQSENFVDTVSFENPKQTLAYLIDSVDR